jgi:hypothetical protein
MNNTEIEKELNDIKDLSSHYYRSKLTTVEQILLCQSKYMLSILAELKGLREDLTLSGINNKQAGDCVPDEV